MSGKGETPTETAADKRSKTQVTVEDEERLERCDLSPTKKVPGDKALAVGITELLEGLLQDASREVGSLLSEYQEVMRERAAVDASHVKELEGIMKEAKTLESFLREKKEQLKSSLALMSEKLQGN